MKTYNIINLVNIVLYEYFKKDYPIYDNNIHLEKAIKWLSLAQDSTKDGGVSEGYHLYHGWLPSYPETTGYIIETFFDYYHYFNSDESIKSRAIRMADWLLSIQNSDGSIPDSYFRKKMVFDTGQVIFGLIRTFEETNEEKYRNAAIHAADWLIKQQESSGEWIYYAANEIAHTYYSRVAWSLLKVQSVTSNDKYKKACIKNIEWCLKQSNENGWFNQASFTMHSHQKPFTHTIAYTLRGILEAGLYLNKKHYIDAVKYSLDQLIVRLPSNGFVCGAYDKEWRGDDKYSCLTGNMQLAIILNKMYLATGIDKYHRQALIINNFTKSKQVTQTKYINICGALAGSYPIWGKYIHYCYPNWATKFFAESLMLESIAITKKNAE